MQILDVIRRHGWTLTAVAEEMGVTKGSVSQAINASPSYTTMKRIADIIGAKVYEFFEDEVQSDRNAMQPDLTTIDKDGQKHYYIEIFPTQL